MSLNDVVLAANLESEVVLYKKNQINILVLDLDGTFADNRWRHHLLPKGDGSHTEQWKAFNQACEGDSLIEKTYEALEIMYDYYDNLQINIVTGRSESSREQTKNWLRENKIPYDLLIMRPDNCHLKAEAFKMPLFKGYNKNSTVFFEDDPSIIRALTIWSSAYIYRVPSFCAAVEAGVSYDGGSKFNWEPVLPRVIGGRFRTSFAEKIKGMEWGTWDEEDDDQEEGHCCGWSGVR